MRLAALVAIVATTLVATACATPEAAGDDPSLRLVEERLVEVRGLSPGTLERIADLPDAARVELLSVRTRAAADDPRAPAMLGSHRIHGDRLVFEPRFPFAPGEAFVARYTPPDGIAAVELEFAIEATDAPGRTRVVAVYPSADVWPMNQLKMYVHFSAPMRPGGAFEHIRLVDRSTGAEVEQPFVTVQEELWDRERTILTVLYDPARIKRGLAPHLEAGLPLQAGGAYRLRIDAGWRDGEGRPLAASYSREFDVVDPDRSSPNPSGWRVDVPRAGSRDALLLTFDEPMDHGLLHSLIGVRRSRAGDATRTGGWHADSDTLPADEVAGTAEVASGETVWRFRPREAWETGTYEIVVPTILEDLAGNTLRGPFDAEVGDAGTPFSATEAAYFAFEIAAAATGR